MPEDNLAPLVTPHGHLVLAAAPDAPALAGGKVWYKLSIAEQLAEHPGGHDPRASVLA